MICDEYKYLTIYTETVSIGFNKVKIYTHILWTSLKIHKSVKVKKFIIKLKLCFENRASNWFSIQNDPINCIVYKTVC